MIFENYILEVKNEMLQTTREWKTDHRIDGKLPKKGNFASGIKNDSQSHKMAKIAK